MERIPEKIDFDAVYSLYEGRRDEPRQSVDIESINIPDKKGLQDKMNKVVQNAASLYQQIGEDSPDGVLKDWPELRINSVPVLAQVVDETIPLSLLVMKTFKHDKDSNERSETVKVELVRGRLEGTNPKDVYNAWRAELSSGNVIGGMEFANRGEVFDLRDREVYAKFRNQGFASMLLKSSEEFIRSVSTDAQSPRIAQAGDVGQLDVLCWLWNRGYRPKTDEEMDLIQKIFSGDSSLRLATLNEPGGGQSLDLCIIDVNVPEHERTRQNYHRITKKVNLVRGINPGDSKEVASISADVANKVESLDFSK